MAKRSKLYAALDARKGRDHEAERQKKLQKLAGKRKRERAAKEPGDDEIAEEEKGVKVNGSHPLPEEESEGWESDESEVADAPVVQTSGILDDESDSDSSLGGDEGPLVRQEAPPNGLQSTQQNGAESEDEEQEEDIPLSDIDSLASEEKADLLPHQRLTINNTTALTKAYKSIALPYPTLPFAVHQTVTTSSPVHIPDINDDLNRELAFYKQCLDAAEIGRIRLKKEGVPFTRPTDYFAEMVKGEEQMGKVKQKMVDEAASKKASAEARRQRDLKKFGKQVQVAKLQERSKAKRDALEKIEVLKRKRKNTDTGLTNEEDLFDIALDNETSNTKSTQKGGATGRNSNPRRDANPTKRRKKDEKFGFGGKKRFTKSNDAASTGDLKGFSAKRMKAQGGGGGGSGGAGKKRLGKSKRVARRT